MSSEIITANDLKAVLDEILPIYSSTGFIVKYYTATSATSVSANGGTAWFQVRVPSTDNPISIVGYYLNGGSGCSVYNLALQVDTNGHYASFAVRNGATTAASITATVYVLCKQELAHFNQEQADYIVEQGTSGIWTYRKWNSGIAECWGKLTRSSSLASNAHANITSALPTFFVNEEPIITGSGGGNAQPNAFMAYVNIYGSSGAYGIDAYVRNNGGSAISSQWLRFYVIGKWK